MTGRSDDHHDERLIQLVVQLDEQISQDQPSGDLLAQSADQFSPAELRELQQAGEALEFLNRVRRNLNVLRALGQELSGDSADPHRSPSEADVATCQTAGHDTRCDPPTSRRRPDEVPRSLGRFEVLDVLGQGGFSRVFLARDPQLDRLVALKVPLPHTLGNAAARRRFEREGRAAAILSHPAIVPIFEAGSLGPVSYIAFAFCPGQNLHQWLAARQRTVPAEAAADMVAELAEATEHAHRRGIVHRDLKPANILVEATETDSPAGEDPSTLASRLRITDFGLAHLQADREESVTLDGAVVGTPAYMSPEQARGAGEIGAASDIYALGTILYELLTGRLPFQGASHLATLRAIEADPPVPPRNFDPSLPRDLEAICLKCLRKSPRDRYASAFELAADLRRWRSGVPTLARPMTWPEQMITWAQRHPAVALLSAVTILSLALGLGIALWQRQNALANLVEAERQRQNAETNLIMAQQQSERASAHLVNAQQLINEIIGLEQKLRHSTEFAGLRHDLIKRAAELQTELMQRETDSDIVKYQGAMALSNLSPLLIELGEDDLAITNAHQALSLFDELAAKGVLPREANPTQFYFVRQGVRMNLVDLYQQRGDFAEAVELVRANLAQPHPDHFSGYQSAILHSENYRCLANVYVQMQQTQEAIDTLRAGLACLDNVEPPPGKRGAWDVNLMTCRLRNGLAEQLRSMGQLDEAERSLAISAAAAEVLLTLFPESPFAQEAAGGVEFTRAALHAARGERAQAIACLRQGESRYLPLHEATPDHVPFALATLRAGVEIARLQLAAGQPEDAAATAEAVRNRHASLADALQTRDDVATEMARLAEMLASQPPADGGDVESP